MQLGVDAYYRDSYVDDCKEETQVDDSSWSFTYGDHLKISVKWFCDDDIVTIQKQASNELVTVYCDVEDTNRLLDCSFSFSISDIQVLIIQSLSFQFVIFVYRYAMKKRNTAELL